MYIGKVIKSEAEGGAPSKTQKFSVPIKKVQLKAVRGTS